MQVKQMTKKKSKCAAMWRQISQDSVYDLLLAALLHFKGILTFYFF